ncbi:MAG: hypothetical protein Nk1A_9210 [Endomicrobiia bacterium]|nr:MAG: hypothetical protein Nk1A_9210 [Endomicrobiia bacterium]
MKECRKLERIDEFIEQLGKLWKWLPDERFGQVVLYIAEVIRDKYGKDYVGMEDGELLKIIKNMIEEAEETYYMLGCDTPEKLVEEINKTRGIAK